MDIRCPICGEPWEITEIQELLDDEAGPEDYHKAVSLFRAKGCEAFGAKHNETSDKYAAELSSMLFAVLGDDVDGIAVELEDAEFLGII